MVVEKWSATEFFLILNHFLPFYHANKPRKSNFWKNDKNCWRYHHFKQVYQKPQSYEVQLLRYGMRLTEFFVNLGHFLPFYPLTTTKIKINKNKKSIWRWHHFTHKYQKSQSYHVCFLRYEIQKTIFYFGPFFCPFTPLLTTKRNIWNNCKKNPLEILSYYTCVP